MYLNCLKLSGLEEYPVTEQVVRPHIYWMHMGKKSRLKKERTKLRVIENSEYNLLSKLSTIDSYNKPIYRFFPEKWQAEALCKGNVWVSTLETCRTYEDPLQGDAEEATHNYNSGHIFGDMSNPDFAKIASRSRISVDQGARDITISNNTYIQKLPDALVLCTTKEFSPEKLSDTFGNYCVKISNPIEFFMRTSIKLNERVKIKQGVMGKIQYNERFYTGLDVPPGPIGFVKPSDRYSSQKEFRFLWLPEDNSTIEPFLLECPNVADLCSEIT